MQTTPVPIAQLVASALKQGFSTTTVILKAHSDCAKGPISLSAWVLRSLSIAGNFGWGVGFRRPVLLQTLRHPL